MGQLLCRSHPFSTSFEPIPAWPTSSVQSSWLAPSVTQRFKKGLETFDLEVTQQSPEAAFKNPIVHDNIDAVSRIDLSNAALLDFGCGNGLYYAILSTYPATTGWNYVGADLNAELVRFCRTKYPGTRFELVADAQVLPFKDGEFDIVFASGVIQYIMDYGTVLSELYRVSSDYAIISRLPVWKHNTAQTVLQHVHHEWGEEHHPMHVFNRDSIEALFINLGFTILWHDYGSELFYVAGVVEPVVNNTYVLRK